jgi:hypothetical protein
VVVAFETMIAVVLYIAATAPFLPLLLLTHRLQGAYTAPFIVALVLQLIPIGLVFLPLGFVGLAILVATLAMVHRRLRAFRRSGLDNPEVHARWIREYLANLVALGLALEQKGAALLFLEASSRQGLGHLWWVLLPASVALWVPLGVVIRREWRRLRAIGPLF